VRASVQPILKALGDDTRFRIYTWLREQAAPVCISDIAAEFQLHPNTVRPHLERLREAGLVRLDATPRGSVGRPQHRYTAVHAEIELHRQGEGYELLATMLAGLCCRASVDTAEAVSTGREVGNRLAAGLYDDAGPLAAVEGTMAHLGFEPNVDPPCVQFTACPFRSLAEEHPELVCALHHGITSGVAEAAGGRVHEFHGLHAKGPCEAFVS
jgi:predicted ArsR family transcriptional regulator